MTVPNAPGATPESGAYTYVRIIARRSGGTTRTRWEWLLPAPVAPPAGGDSVKVATFNIRTWGADSSQKARTSWTNRRARVVKQMVNSGAGVFLLQEASGSPKSRVAGKRWQYQDLASRMPDRYALARRSTYTYKGRTAGAQGNRIIYDASRYAKRDAGYFRLPTDSMSTNRWVPWVLLRSKKTGAEFYAMSMHLTSGDDKPGLHPLLRLPPEAGHQDGQQRQGARRQRPHRLRRRRLQLDQQPAALQQRAPDLRGRRLLRRLLDLRHQPDERVVPDDERLPVPGHEQPYRRDYVMALHPTAKGDVAADPDLAGSYAFKNYVYQSMSSVASDHFMQSATMPVKPGPY